MNKIKKKMSNILKNDFWSKLLLNITTVLIGNGGSSIINLIVTIIMTRVLGNSTYGIFLLALQYMNLIDGIVNFQSWAGVIKYGSEAIVEGNEERLAVIYKSGFLIDIVTAVLGSIVALFILPFSVKVMGWNDQLALLAGMFSFEILFHLEGTSVGILRLYDRFSLTATQAVVSALIKFVLIGVYFLVGGRSLVVVTILYIITDIVKHLMLVAMALKVLQEKMGIQKVVRSSVKQTDGSFLKYTIWNNISYTADVPVKYFDIFIISFISVDMVAIYKVFKQIVQVLSMLVNPISQAILPQFSEMVAKEKIKEALGKVFKLRNAILLVGVIVVFGSLILGKPIFTLVLGVEYGNNLLMFETLLIVKILLMSYITIHPFFSSLGIAKIDFIFTAVSNIIYIVVAIATVKLLGIYAIILAMAIQGTTLICMKYFYVKEHFVDISS